VTALHLLVMTTGNEGALMKISDRFEGSLQCCFFENDLRGEGTAGVALTTVGTE